MVARHPVLVTTRLEQINTLRGQRVHRVVEQCLAAGAHREHFRLVHFSVQTNHLHLICEAADRSALSRGRQGLLSRIARTLNRAAVAGVGCSPTATTTAS